MAILGEGFDKRQERLACEALPICDDCPNQMLREALKAGRASTDEAVKGATKVAEQLLRQAGCEAPREVPASEADDEFAVPDGSPKMACANPNSTAATTVLTHTQYATAREQ